MGFEYGCVGKYNKIFVFFVYEIFFKEIWIGFKKLIVFKLFIIIYILIKFV